MIGFEPGYEARVVADDVTFTLPEYLLQAALDASYAAKDHTHTADQISGLEGALGSYLTKTDAANTYQTRLATAAGSDDVGDTDRFIWRKTSDNSILTTSWFNIKAKLRTYFETLFAKVIHSHSIGEVEGLQTQLNTKFPTTGGKLSGELGAVTTVAVYGDGNAHLWFRKTDGTEKGVIWAEASSGNLCFRSKGLTTYIAPSGQFWAATDLVARGVVYAGSGSARLETNGNVVGNIWSNWGSSDAYTAIDRRIEQRSSDWGWQHASSKARKCGSWDQWNFTSHDQRAQNGTGENIYYTARITGTYADTVQLQVSPNNVDFWTVGTTTAAGNSTNLEYTSGCLPPGWWMRIIRGSGNYNANVILVW